VKLTKIKCNMTLKRIEGIKCEIHNGDYHSPFWARDLMPNTAREQIFVSKFTLKKMKYEYREIMKK